MKRLLALAAFLLVIAPAFAQAARCTVSASPIAFGLYAPFSASPTDSTGTLTISCRGRVRTYTVTLGAGLNSGGRFANRSLSSGSARLSYQLYSDAARTTVWGDGTGGTDTLSGSCLGRTCSPGTLTVYARLPALQTAAPGSYSDNVTVTIIY